MNLNMLSLNKLHKSASLYLFLFSLSFSCFAQHNNFPWPEGQRAAISLSFDDARNSQPLVGKDLFRRLGIKVTYYVLPWGVRDHLEDWKAIVADGHEIGNHTVDHPCTGNFPWSRNNALENYSLASMREELLEANQLLKDLLGVVPVSFAYTCGDTYVGRGGQTKSYIPLVHELFESGRNYMDECANDPTIASLARLQGIDMDGKDFEKDIKPRIDEAIARGSWLVLAGHEIGEGGQQTVQIKMLEKLTAYVKERSKDIWTAPVGDVAAHIKKERKRQAKELKKSLSFCSTFDHGTDADYAKGDAKMYGAMKYAPGESGIANMMPAEVGIANGKGHFGNALEFKRKGKPTVYYASANNIPYDKTNWNGTISLWLSLDPAKDLAPGFTDPIQITDSGYDDAGLWVDFTKENPRSFRMGIFGDVKVWNPEKKKPDANPAFDNRLVLAKEPPFSRGRWTHVVISYTGLNSSNGKADFYINGQLQGTSQNIKEPFTWDYDKSKIFLGLNFIGLMDEVSIFNRALSADEVNMLYQLPEGLNSILSLE